MACEIDTAAKRAKLTPRKNPYWHSIAGGRGGVTLGYRRPARGGGAWIGKIVVEGERAEERLGVADDDRAAPGAISYRAAVSLTLDWSRQQFARIEARRDRTTAEAGKGPTVRSAVEAYSKGRPNAAGRLRRHVLSDDEFADTRLAKLRSSDLEAWRDRLPMRSDVLPPEAAKDDATPLEAVEVDAQPEEISPATVNRLMNDLRAALNSSAVKHRRELPALLPAEIRVGTKAIAAVTRARRQLLTDVQVCELVDAAFDVDPSGDFGRLVLLLASTGARHSQIAAVKIADLQPDNGRVMVPGSRKGRAKSPKPPIARTLPPDVIERLLPQTTGRGPSEPLLLRWHHRKTGKCSWIRDVRRPWGAACEADTFWPFALERAGLPSDTVMYALRHSSIVRGLRAMLPVRLVAALHDTSTEMIEAHYAAFIVDVTEDLARRATMSFASAPSRLLPVAA